MTARVHAVAFRNRNGQQLVGMVHEPTGVPSTVGVVLLSPGVKNRVAPHRLYNRLAAALCARGHWVLRFDFNGLGDSEGRVDEQLLRELYATVAVGRYVADTRDALDWMAETFGCQRFVTGGLCGGALTGLLEAQDDRRVVGIVGIGMPMMLDSPNVDPRQFMTRGQLHSLRARYFQKLLSPRAWLRFLSMRTDYRTLMKSMSAMLRSGRRQGPSHASQPAAAGQPPDNANPLFAPALFATLSRGCPILMLFSGADRLYWEFEEKFLTQHRARYEALASMVSLHVIESANHILTFESWQQEAEAHIARWFDTVSPIDERASLSGAETVDAR